MEYTETPSKFRAIAIIPARYQSTRLPGKALLPIAGRPMVLHVLDRVLAASTVSRALVATDDTRILDVVLNAGFEAVMTSANHVSGSDRVAEVAATLGDFDIIVNVQGDEPLIAPQTIDSAVNALIDDPDARVATTFEVITRPEDVLSTGIVKVVLDNRGRALYFSRSPIPYPQQAITRHGSLKNALAEEPDLVSQFLKHTGLYAYRRAFLLEYSGWRSTILERAESLEQLRILERGGVIHAVPTMSPSIGVDTAEDLERVRRLVQSSKFKVQS